MSYFIIHGSLMRYTDTYGLILLMLLLIACGPSAHEKTRIEALQKAREDSIIKAAQDQILLRVALEDDIKSTNSQITGLKALLINTNGELEAAKDKLLVIKQPQFLRTPQEREVQIRNQTIRIGNLENRLSEIDAELKSKMNMINKLNAELKKFHR